MPKYRLRNEWISVTDSRLEVGEINEILALDTLVYPEHYRSDFEQVSLRYYRFMDCFVTARINDRIIGYICFFPITSALSLDIIDGRLSTDIDIDDQNVLPLIDNEGTLYVISIVVDPEFQHTHVIKWIMNLFETKLIDYRDGFGINKVLASVISEGGYNVLNKSKFTVVYFDNEQKFQIMQRELLEG